jgi:hypothetical protein
VSIALFVPKPPALLPVMVLLVIVSGPKLRIPPPSLETELLLIVLLVTVSVADEPMPPGPPNLRGVNRQY